MSRQALRRKMAGLLSLAGVEINGSRDWDIQVHQEKFYARVLSEGSLGLGESYMDGWWDCRRLDEFFDRVVRAGLDTQVLSWRDYATIARMKIFNLQRLARAYQIGRHHYDLGNDLFRCMLDDRMIYSCGYWKDRSNLSDAQEAKLDLIARKLQLEPGMKVLDIGCGWGGAARFLAERYGVHVVGVTVSEEQVNCARQDSHGLPVEIRLQDYRQIEGIFDRILSVGMFEHVGIKNHAAFMHTVREHLSSDGLFLLHTIGRNDSSVACDAWIIRYIFPNSLLPSARWISAAAERDFVIEDWHNFGADYDKTLMAWHRNFQEHWGRLREKYGERFRRMWEYYLLSCAGSFRARQLQLWQIVLSPGGIPGGYRAPR